MSVCKHASRQAGPSAPRFCAAGAIKKARQAKASGPMTRRGKIQFGYASAVLCNVQQTAGRNDGIENISIAVQKSQHWKKVFKKFTNFFLKAVDFSFYKEYTIVINGFKN
mgnify:CR=1 FL=1